MVGFYPGARGGARPRGRVRGQPDHGPARRRRSARRQRSRTPGRRASALVCVATRPPQRPRRGQRREALRLHRVIGKGPHRAELPACRRRRRRATPFAQRFRKRNGSVAPARTRAADADDLRRWGRPPTRGPRTLRSWSRSRHLDRLRGYRQRAGAEPADRSRQTPPASAAGSLAGSPSGSRGGAARHRARHSGACQASVE